MHAVQSKTLFAVVLLLAAVAASLLTAGEQTAQVNAAGIGSILQTGTGILSGTITEAASSSPLAGIEVCAVGNSDGTYRCTQTGANGVYAFTGLATGNYSVGVNQEGWAFETYDGGVYYDYYDAIHIQVIDGQVTTGIDFVLDPGGAVSGTATDSSGTPLSGVYVQLVTRDKSFFTCTDGSGNYEFRDISYEESNSSYVTARVDPACPNSLPAYAVENWQEQPAWPNLAIPFTRADPTFEHINFTFEPGGSISGMVTSTASGSPMEGISVCAGPSFDLDRFCAKSAADGTYTIHGLSTYTEYLVRVQADGWAWEFYNNRHTFRYATLVSVTAGQDTPGINFALEPGGVISGTVTGPDGQPVEGAIVTIGTVTRTDASGRYRFASLSYDGYYLAHAMVYDERGHLLYNTEFWQENPWYGNELWLTSETPERNGIDFTLDPLGAITGTVRATSGEALADQIVCRDAEHDNWSYLDRCAYTDSYGRYTLIVPYDLFWVFTFDRANNYVYYDNPKTSMEQDQVIVHYGQVVSGINLVTNPCFQASDGTLLNEVALNWCVAAGADHFEVYRTPPQGNAVRIGTTTGIAYSDTSAVPDVRYTYKVKACTGGICSNFSAPDTGWCSIPIPHVSASNGSLTDRIRVSWEAIPDISSYQIYRSTSADQQGELIATVTDAFYDDDSVPPGPTYYYRVKACSQSYCSTASPAEPGWRAVAAPAGLNASSDQSSGIALTWEAVWDNLTYEVYRTMLDPAGVERSVGIANAASFVDSSAIPGYSYSYQVRSCYESNCSALSSAESGTRTMPAPAGLGQHDDSGGMVFYEGGWVAEDTGTALNRTLHSTESMGDFAVFFFQGRCASLHFTAGKQFGQIDIYLDDVYLSTLSQYIPGQGVPLQTAPLCALDGLHTLRLVSAGVELINIDAISVVEPVEYEYQYFAPLFR